jgi:hypothetical protein
VTLASGQITASDTIVVELVTSAHTPPIVLIHWPVKATTVGPAAYADTASKIMRILARANIELARIRLAQ